MDGIPLRFADADWKDVPEDIKKVVSNLVGTRRGAYLFGQIGCGKTHIAYAIKKHFEAEYHIPVWVINTTWLLHSLRLDFDRRPIDREWIDDKIMKSKGLIIFDDIGVEKVTDWVAEAMYLMINERYEAMKPMIFTSNLSLDELSTKIGDRVPSRIAGMCDIIEIKGTDRRTVS